MSRKEKVVLLTCLMLLIFICPAATQVQPVVLGAYRAVDGTFGLRIMSHKCLGLQADSTRLPYLPSGGWQFHFGAFSFRYDFREEYRRIDIPMCVGQDVWYGE